MNTPQHIDVTYTGSETPFVDRIYHTGLSFEPGQTRALPAAIAHRFLRHIDVFQEGEQAKEPKAAKASKAVEKPVDNTAAQLAEGQKANDKRMEQENARFELLQQVERMDRDSLRAMAKVNWGQTIHPKTGVEKVRDMVRGFIDQYGTP